MERSIDELLSDEPVETVEAPEPQEEVAAEPEVQADDRPRNPDGTFASKQTGEPQQEEPVAEATPATDNPIPEDQFKGYLTEKRKRQELEQQVAAMQSQFEALQAQSRSAQPQEMPPTFWDDPDKAIEARVAQAAELAIQRYQQQQTMERINASEAAAKAKHADYDDAFRAFQQAATANPSLVQQMTSASDPAEFAYSKGKTALQLEQVGSIDELLKAERAKWEAEVRAAIPQPQQTFPASTAADGSVGARSGPTWAGPPPIEQLIG